MGISDAEILSRLIALNLEKGKSLNNVGYLQDYEDESYKNNLSMQSFV